MFWYFSLLYSDADLPDVSSKDTQTESSGDTAAAEGVEKTDQDKADKKENVKQWSIDRIKKEYRRFNIDLAPKVSNCSPYRHIFLIFFCQYMT